MVADSEELKEDFHKASSTVYFALDDVKAKSREAQKELEIEKKKTEGSHTAALEAEASAKKIFDDSQKRAEVAYEKQTSLSGKLYDFSIKGLGAITSVGTGKTLASLQQADGGDSGIHEKIITEANAEKKKLLEEKLKQQNLRKEANLKMIEFSRANKKL